VPLLRDIVQGWKENNDLSATSKSPLFSASKGAVTRHVRFVWVVKSRGQLDMFSEQLSSVYTSFQSLQEQTRSIKLEVTIYVTCDEAFTEEHKSLVSTVTAPKSTSTPKRAVQHGIAEPRNRSMVGKDQETEDEVKKILFSGSSAEELDACRCRTTINEASTSAPAPCCCRTLSNDADGSSRTSTSSARRPRKDALLVHPAMQIFSGRPQTKEIIRRSLEQAFGESAVVVCGPQGLVSDVKQNVVELSDERAVHKGTGAQGVYLHTESFGY